MQDLRVYSLVHKRLVGEITERELDELATLELDGDYRQIVEEIEEIWVESKDFVPPHTFDVAAAKEKFQSKLRKEKLGATPVSSDDTSSPRRYIIGALLLMALASVGYFVYQYLSEDSQFIEATQEVEYALLDDGSEVWMRRGTRIDVSDFDIDGDRLLRLSGEAFFKVVPDGAHPFVVDLQDGHMLRVTGTSFNAMADQNGVAEVIVQEGVVQLYTDRDAASAVEIRAGERGTLDRSVEGINKAIISQLRTVRGTALSFRETALSQVFDDIADVYGVTIDVSPTTDLGSCRFTSPLIADADITEVLALLRASYVNLSLSLEDDLLQVSGRCLE